MKITIELLYTPLKKQSIKQKIVTRLIKKVTKVLYGSKIKNDEKIKKIKKIRYGSKRKKKNIIDQKNK